MKFLLNDNSWFNEQVKEILFWQVVHHGYVLIFCELLLELEYNVNLLIVNAVQFLKLITLSVELKKTFHRKL